MGFRIMYLTFLRGQHHALDLTEASVVIEVHCFHHVVVGLKEHMIEREGNLDELGMLGFSIF